jgi:RNA recognition motif-containing protein
MDTRCLDMIYISPVPFDIKKEQIEGMFQNYGPVVKVTFPSEEKIDASLLEHNLRYAFVQFAFEESARDAVEMAYCVPFWGETLQIKYAIDNRKTSDEASNSDGSVCKPESSDDSIRTSESNISEGKYK